MKIDVLETTLRDGVQAEGINYSNEDKLALIGLFDNLGLQYIEAGTPYANPKDKQFLCDNPLPQTAVSNIVAFGATRRKNSLSDEDLALKTLVSSNAKYISIVGKSSVLHLEKVLDVSEADNITMIYDTIRYLSDNGKQVFFDAEHFFDGYKLNPEYAISTLRTARDAGASVLVLCDTNGASMPEEIYDVVKKVKRTFKKTKIGIHCHNDSGLAVANTLAAVDGGAEHIQGTFLGFGERCGNCNLATAILNLQLKKGYEIVSEDAVKRFTVTARHVAEITNISLPKNVPYVGRSAFSHKAGMHGDGVIKYSPAFEHIDPSDVGNERKFLLSEVAGRAVFAKKAAAICPDIEFSSENVSTLLASLKLAEMQGYQFEGADASFNIFIRKALGLFNQSFDLVKFNVVSNLPSDEEESAVADIKIKVNDVTREARATGNGPVNALDTALRSALSGFYPVINDITLLDYKVRVLNSEAATKAKVRVLITSTDSYDTWTTVGVSTDIIEASWIALCDSVEYILAKRNLG